MLLLFFNVFALVESTVYHHSYLNQWQAPWFAWNKYSLEQDQGAHLACASMCENRERGSCNAFRLRNGTDCELSFVGHNYISNQPVNNSLPIFYSTRRQHDTSMILLYNRGPKFVGYNIHGDCDPFPNDDLTYVNPHDALGNAISTFAIHTWLYCEGNTVNCYYVDMRRRPLKWEGPVLVYQARRYATMVASGSKIYILAGRTGDSNANAIEVFDVETKTMERWIDPITGDPVNIDPAYRTLACAIPVDQDHVVVTGGQETKITHQLNLVTRQMTNLPPLLEIRFLHACGKINYGGKEYLMVAGGLRNQGNVTNTMEFLDWNLKDAWTRLPGLEFPAPTYGNTGLITNFGPENDVFIFMPHKPIFVIKQNGTIEQIGPAKSYSLGHLAMVPSNLFSECSLF